MTISKSAATILVTTALLALGACDDKKDESKDGDKKKGADTVAINSPDLCDHMKENGGKLKGDRCIMRLDGLQLQLGDDDFKTHGECIGKGKSEEDFAECIKAADKASIAKHKAK